MAMKIKKLNRLRICWFKKTAAKNYKLMQLQKNCPSAQFPVIDKMIRNIKQKTV